MRNWIKGGRRYNDRDNAESKNRNGILRDILGTAPLAQLRNLGLQFGQRVISHAGTTRGVIMLLFKEREGLKMVPYAIIALDYPQLPTQNDGSNQEDLSLLERVDVLRACLGIDTGEISIIKGAEELQKLQQDSLTPLDARRVSLLNAKFVCQICAVLVTAKDAICCDTGHVFCSCHLEDTLPLGATLQSLAGAVNAVSLAGIPDAELWALAACRTGGARSEEEAVKWSLDHCISGTSSLSPSLPLNCPIPTCNGNLVVCELAPVRERLSLLLQMRGELFSDEINRSSPPHSVPFIEDLDFDHMKKSPPAVINSIHGVNRDIKGYYIAEEFEAAPIAATLPLPTSSSLHKLLPTRVVHVSWDKTSRWRERKCAVILPRMDWSSVLVLCRHLAGLPKDSVVELYHEDVPATEEWSGSNSVDFPTPLPVKTEVVWLDDIVNGDELVLEVPGGMRPPKIGALEKIPLVYGIYGRDSTMPVVFDELESWYGSFRRVRGDGNCYFRAMAFRALEYFMSGCDETSAEREKGFSKLILNLRPLNFGLVEHRVEHEKLLGKLSFWQQALGWKSEGEENIVKEEDSSSVEEQKLEEEEQLCCMARNGDEKKNINGMRSNSVALAANHDSSENSSLMSELEDEFFPHYKDSVSEQIPVASEMRAEFIDEESRFDAAIIRACRKLVSNHLLDFADTRTPGGLTYRQLIEAQQLSVEQYCNEVVDRQSEDARDFWVEMGLLPELLGVKSFLIVINDGTNDVHLGREVQLLLYKQHYDLIYGSVEHWRGNGPKRESEAFCRDLKKGLMELRKTESQSNPQMLHLSDAIPSHLMA